MIVTRRRALQVGGGFLAALFAKSGLAAGETIDISMRGKEDGSHVWFDPVGILVQPGQTVRWTNRDPGNSHTVTTYHPEFFDRPLRIPARARPWHSDYLLPDETFSVTFEQEGVYDYYCVPHEHAGMVGRIVVGSPGSSAGPGKDEAGLIPVPPAALAGFPPVEEIIAKRTVRPR